MAVSCVVGAADALLMLLTEAFAMVWLTHAQSKRIAITVCSGEEVVGTKAPE